MGVKLEMKWIKTSLISNTFSSLWTPFGKQNGWCGMNRTLRFKCAWAVHSFRYHKKCCCIKTFGLWPWKLESAKECVKTRRTNATALKINGAKSVPTYKRQMEREIFNLHFVSWCDAFYCSRKATIDIKEKKSDLFWIMHQYRSWW